MRRCLTTAPKDLQPGDILPKKIVAVLGQADDWAAYEGPTHHTDMQVSQRGDKLSADAARLLFPQLRHLAYRS